MIEKINEQQANRCQETVGQETVVKYQKIYVGVMHWWSGVRQEASLIRHFESGPYAVWRYSVLQLIVSKPYAISVCVQSM